MKRLLSLSLAALLAVLLCLPAAAAGSAALVRAFVSGDTLYAYVELSGVEGPITKADAAIGSQTFPAQGTLETVRQAGSPVSYLLLVDCSTSMPGFREDVAAFAGALAASAGESTGFTLATFGESFEVLGEAIAPADLPAAVDAIQYTATQSRLHGGLEGALDYFEALPRQGGELRSLVVLTDAVEYDADGDIAFEDLLDRVARSDVMLHGVGFGGDSQALAGLVQLTETSLGRCWLIGLEDDTADGAAQALTDYTGGLLVVGFDISARSAAGTETVTVTFGSGAEPVARAEAAVVLPEASEAPAGGDDEPVVLPDPPAPSGGASSAPPSAADPETPDSAPISPTVLAGGAVAVVLVLAILAALLLRRRQGKKTPPQAASPAPPASPVQPPAEAGAPGIFLRLEVVQGELTSGLTEWTLSDELVIGRDAACAVAFADPSISRRHARVFLTGGAVYLEDLGSQNGTLVNGARIDMANRLRSGDEITVGDTVFRLKF